MSNSTKLSMLDKKSLFIGYAFRAERDREIITLSRNAEIRYINAIKNLRNKFKSTFACTKDYCPLLRERMEHHMKTRHCDATPSDPGEALPGISMSSLQSLQNGPRYSNIYKCRQNYDSQHHLKVLDIDFDDDSNTDVKDDVTNIFKTFPINPNNSETKQLKNALINNVSDKIDRLIEDGITDEDKIKIEIDNVIHKVLGRYPSKTVEMVNFINKIKSHLCLIPMFQSKKRGYKGKFTTPKGNDQEPMKNKSTLLKEELQNIFKDYPLNTETSNSKDYKDKVINSLVDDVHKILNDKRIPTGVKKAEINDKIESLNGKYSKIKNDDNLVIENIKSKVFDIINRKRSASKTKKSMSSTANYSGNSSTPNSDLMGNNIAKDIRRLFDEYPTLAGKKQIKEKDNIIRKVIEDANKVVAKNKVFNENKIKADIDSIVAKMSLQLPALKKDIKFKNNVKERLFKIIKDSYKDTRPTFNNFAKSNPTTSGNNGENSFEGGGTIDKNSNSSKSGNMSRNGNYSRINNMGRIGAGRLKTARSDSDLFSQNADIKRDPKSELRQILESSVHPQIQEERKNSLINNLFDDIQAVKRNGNLKTDADIKNELNTLIQKLPLWYPGAKRDQVKYVNDLKDKLFKFIKDPNLGVNNFSYGKNKYIKDKYKSKLSVIDDSVLTLYKDNNLAEYYVRKWVDDIRNEDFMADVDTEDLIKSITDRIVPILHKNSCGKKIILKGAILETLSYIPTTFKCNLKLQKLVAELVNNLNKAYRNIPNDCCNTVSKTMFLNIYRDFSKVNALKNVENCLNEAQMAENDVRDEIAELIMSHSDCVFLEDEIELENDILQDLAQTDAPESEILLTAKHLKECLYKNIDVQSTSTLYPSRKSIAIFTTDIDSINKLNDEELDYIHKVSNLVRAWMDTLPIQFNAPEERGFKESMISELAGEIMDINKIEQIIPFKGDDKNNYLKYLAYKWIIKFNVFDIDELVPYIDDFLVKLKEITVLTLTKSHRGTRQMMDNIKHMEGEKGWKEHYVPKGIDILEDEISIWVHEQPPDLFTFDKYNRNDNIHELATVIQPKIANKVNENVIEQDLGQWLSKNVKNKNKIKDLQRDLKDRVINLPQDATLIANLEEKLDEKLLIEEQRAKLRNRPPSLPNIDETFDMDRTIKDYISKFIQHNYDIDDTLARDAFNHLLKRKLQRLNEQNKQAICTCSLDTFIVAPDKLFRELEYIKIISDWLKNIPLEAYFNRPGNKERIDFIIGLGRTLSEVEDERARMPCAMDFDTYTGSLITTHLMTLPMQEGYKICPNITTLVNQMLTKLEKSREIIKIKIAESFSNDSGINDENLGDFLEEFIRIYGCDIADDEVKMEAWSIRLIREIRKIVQHKGPEVTKNHVYKQIVTIPTPGDEIVQRFETELMYIEEISEWMKNLPLTPVNQEEEDSKKRMICDLAEYLAAKDVISIDDTDLIEYLTQWISELPTDRTHNIVIPMLIKQLINRMNRQHNTEKESMIEVVIDRKSNVVKSKSSTAALSPGKIVVDAIEKWSKSSTAALSPGKIVVDAIEKWSKSLPLNNEDSLRDDAAKHLYQKVGELNTDPLIYNDDLLYETFVKNQIETVVEKLPVDAEIQGNSENDEELLQTLVRAKNVAKELSAGDHYKQQLERTLDASVPDPVTNKQTFDPAFEIYKSRLADMFILDNFDHSNDQVKAIYQRKLRKEIDKYFESAQHKNLKTLTKDEIYNELYGNLFKVPIPNEQSAIEEVEKVKTRQIIDTWFEELPLKEADGIIELLDWDKKLDTLTKRVHEIEKTRKFKEKLNKEITKWLNSIPILPNMRENINEYATILMNKLELTVQERKCVVEKDATLSKGKGGKNKRKTSKTKISDEPKTTNIEARGDSAPQRKSADLIVDLVEQWCTNIAITIPPGEKDARNIREELFRKIIIKISELNMDPSIFGDDFIYKEMLNDELEKLLSEVPTCCAFKRVKEERIKQLIQAIIAVKPLTREEKSKITYIENLNKTIDKHLLSDISPETLKNHEAEYEALKEEIKINYVQSNYDTDDVAKQAYTQKIHEAVDSFLTKIKGEANSNPLRKRNQIICELNKIPVPNDKVIVDEVDEIRMKSEVNDFFTKNSLNNLKDKPVDQVKTALAKKLTDIEVTGHTEENDNKMKNEITKSVRKLCSELKPDIIDDFVNKLKANEEERKRRLTSSVATSCESVYCKKKSPQCKDKNIQISNVMKIDKKPGYDNLLHDEVILPGCAKNKARQQSCCPCHINKKKPVCPQPSTRLPCDPEDDPFCYKMPKNCP